MNAPHEINVEHDPITESMMKVLEAQRTDYIAEGHVSAETRIERLQRGIAAVAKHQDRLVDALNEDFSCRPRRCQCSPISPAALPP